MDGERNGRRRRRGAAAIAAVLAFALAFAVLPGAPGGEAASAAASGGARPRAAGHAPADGPAQGAAESGYAAAGWALKWREGAAADPSRLPGTVVRMRQPEIRVDLVEPEEGVDPERWLERLSAHPDVEYVHPVGKVKLLASEGGSGKERTDGVTAAMDRPDRPDDPHLDKQGHLSLIGADRAWSLAPGMATDLTIAVVDTGIDLDHPDLKDNLVDGINLISPGQPPEDDNGHGTRVAGVLAAVGNNGIGTAGVLWKAKIMPVKALDSSGYGDEEMLGEAIVRAVDAGAKIIVLSVGLYRYSPYMLDVVRYAEEKDVLLVAASGNDGVLHGGKAAVKYPAAYPTVFAVAGVASDGSPEPRSNAGPEIDIAAAWEVYTTSRGGGYRKEEGTSMAAPQVAAAAALVWSREPNLKVWQVRERLMQTAQDIGAPGRDHQSGAGLLRVDRALQAKQTPDAREPNDTRQKAAVLPYANQIAGSLSGGTDVDWFKIEVPHDGWLTVTFEGHPGERKSHPAVSATLHRPDGSRTSTEWRKDDSGAEWQVKRGTHWLELKFLNGKDQTVVPYKLTTGFRMAADAFEPNDTREAARQVTLENGRLKLTGTFHRQGDLDWFAVTIDQTGDLKVTLSVDTMRIDPALLIKPERGGPEQRIDDYGEGVTERASIPVNPGRYLIRVRDATSVSSHPVVGTYTLMLEFERRHVDPNEPNDRIYQATTMTPGTEYRGVFAAAGDEDWFRFRLNARSVVTVTLDGVPSDRRVKMEVFDRRQQLIETIETPAGAGGLRVEREYDEGDHYIRLTADRPFDRSLYRLRVNVERLTGGFRDIAGHWAEEAIVKLSGLGLVSGTGNWRFEPDRGISRAESVTLLVRALAPAGSSGARTAYRDVGAGHWAYNAIRRATAAGIVNGMPDGTFGPSRPVTRAEAAVMIGRALGLKPLDAAAPAFADLRPGHWAAPMVNRLKEEGLLIGFPGGRFRPDEPISRAEFSVLLLRALEERRMS